jgi:uncharacterized membrane protein
MDYLLIPLRMLHIVSAMTAVGGMVFIRFALLPALQMLDEGARASLHETIRKRWAMLVHIAITVLLVSGLVNYFLFMSQYKTWGETWKTAFSMQYNMFFGIKFLIALAMFFISSALAGRSAGLQKLRDNAKFWLSINLLLAFVLILLSGLMRQTHLGPTAPSGYEVKIVELGK